MKASKAGLYDDAPIVQAPSTFTVEYQPKPILYLPDGRVMVKCPIGFRTGK